MAEREQFQNDKNTANDDAGNDRTKATTPAASLLAVVVLALSVRLYELGHDAFWLDEAWSLWFTEQSWRYLWFEVPRFEVHPPLFYSLLKLWTFFGVSEFSTRLLPALFGTATAGLAFAASRAALPGRSSLVAAVAAGSYLALHPLQIHYSQELRAYSMMAFSYAVLLTATLWLAANLRQAGLPLWGFGRAGDPAARSRGAMLAWGGIALGGSLCLWTNNTGALFLAACGVPLAALILFDVRQKRLSPWAFYNGLGCALLVLLLWSPWIPALIHQAGMLQGEMWIELDRYRFHRTLGDFLTFQFPGSTRRDVIFAYGILPCILAVAGGVYLLRRRFGVAVVLGTALVLPPLLNLLFSLLVQPVLVTKALLPIAVPFVVLIGFGIQSLRAFRRPVAVLAAWPLAIMLGVGAWKYVTTDNTTEPWREVASVIRASYEPGEVILTLPNFVAFPLRYYLNDSAEADYRVVELPDRYPRLYAVGPAHYRDIDLEPWLEESTGVWLVIRDQPDSDRDVETLRRAAELATHDLEAHFGPLLQIHHFRPGQPLGAATGD